MRRLFLLGFTLIAACAGGASEDLSGADSSTELDTSAVDSSTTTDTATMDATVEDTVDSSAGDTSAGDTSTDAASEVASDGAADVPSEAGDAPPPWPSCDAQPTGTVEKTIPQIWTDDPSMPAFDWISGAIVTAVSQGGCAASKACQIYVQDTSGTDLTAVAHHAIKLFISAKAADRFTGIVPGDKVDIAGYAVRYTVDGQNELLVEVNDLLRGCIKKTGTGTIAPVAATLADLNAVSDYETSLGPVLVSLSNVTGTPSSATSIFGIYPTSGFDAGPDGGTSSIVSLSPYFLSGGGFTGLTYGSKTSFTSVTGVYGMFYPGTGDAGAAIKYLTIYPRGMTEVVK